MTMQTTKTNPTYAPTKSRLSWRGIVGVALLAFCGYLVYGYFQGDTETQFQAQPTPAQEVAKAESDIIGTIITVGVIDPGCTINCANQVKMEVTNAHDGYVWLTDPEGDTLRCLPSVLTPGKQHEVTASQEQPINLHPGAKITFDGRRNPDPSALIAPYRGRQDVGQLQTTIMESSQCKFAYTDMIYRGRSGLAATLSEDEQARLQEDERYCYNHPEDTGCNVGRSTRSFVDGLIDGLQN